MSKAEKFWDLFARRYSKSAIKDEKSYKKTLDDTKRYLKRKAVVLEIGCGTGTTALILAGSVNKMTATDISKNMIAIGKEKAKKQKIKNVNFVQSTLFDKKLKKGSFDVILAFNLIHLLKDTEAVMKRINELLRPNGLFISKTPCLGESRLMPILGFFIRMVIGPITCFTVTEFKASITNVKFEIIDTHIYPEKSPRIFVVARKKG